MKKIFIYLLTTVILGCTMFVSCKKVAQTEEQEEIPVTLTEEQRKEVKASISERNIKFPIVFGTFGTIKHMALKGQHMRVFLELNPRFYNVERMSKEPEIVKRALIGNFAMMDDSYDPMFATLAKNDVGLRIELGSQREEDIMEVYISPEEVLKLSQTKEKDVNYVQVLQDHVNVHNLKLPCDIQNKGRLESMHLTEGYVVCNFTVFEDKGNEMMRLRSGKMVIGSKMLKDLHKTTDPIEKNIIMLCRKAHRRLAYKFTGEKTGIQVTIFFYLTPAK